MWQIFKNYLFILILPLIIGFAVRFLLRKTKLAYLSTVIFVIASIIMWIVSATVYTYGSEMLGIQAAIVTAMAAASLITGLIFKIIKKHK